MSLNEKHEIVVIGAGAVGVCCALWLRRRGHDVMLLDRGDIGAGTSFGNASTIADYACTPVPSPRMWKDAPGLLFGAESPLAIQWSRLPALLPWLIRFFRQCDNRAYRDSASALAHLLKYAYDGYGPLLDENDDARGFLNRRGCIYAYQSHAALRGAADEIALRQAFGISQEVLDARQLALLEPSMSGRAVGGVLFPGASHLNNPQAFIKALGAPLVAEARYVRMAVSAVTGGAGGLTLSGGNADEVVRAERVVVAAGPWSASIAAQFGDRVPLGAERGYHLEFELDDPVLTRPTCLVEKGFYMTPLAGKRLRAAGTIELGGLQLVPTAKRLAYIEKHIRHVMEIKAPVASRWLGIRPTFPDYLPVIGPSSKDARVLYAFGHQHLGITLAGITGRKIADFVAGRGWDGGEPFSVRRFA